MSAVPCWRLTVFPRSFLSLPEHKGVYQPVMIKQQNLVLRKDKEWHRTKKCTYLCRVESKQKKAGKNETRGDTEEEKWPCIRAEKTLVHLGMWGAPATSMEGVTSAK